MSASSQYLGRAELLRLRALEQYQLLGTLAGSGLEANLLELTTLAADICGTPLAGISIIHGDAIQFLARVGSGPQRVMRGRMPCEICIQRHGVLEIPDARYHPAFRPDGILVSGRTLRFYAGAPLITPARRHPGRALRPGRHAASAQPAAKVRTHYSGQAGDRPLRVACARTFHGLRLPRSPSCRVRPHRRTKLRLNSAGHRRRAGRGLRYRRTHRALQSHLRAGHRLRLLDAGRPLPSGKSSFPKKTSTNPSPTSSACVPANFPPASRTAGSIATAPCAASPGPQPPSWMNRAGRTSSSPPVSMSPNSEMPSQPSKKVKPATGSWSKAHSA